MSRRRLTSQIAYQVAVNAIHILQTVVRRKNSVADEEVVLRAAERITVKFYQSNGARSRSRLLQLPPVSDNAISVQFLLLLFSQPTLSPSSAFTSSGISLLNS